MLNEVHIVIESRAKDLMGMPISRVLPWNKKRMVGPFIFLDHMGPVHFGSDDHKMEVNPHPHIGLSTLTYLFRGHIHHKDSLGNSVVIIPGEVNWMTAGKGISHSEKTPHTEEHMEADVHGLQFWVALPDHLEDMEPSFYNYKNAQIPKLESDEASIDVVVGEFSNQISPVKTHCPVVFVNFRAKKDYIFKHSSGTHEMALYLIEGSLSVAGVTYSNHEMIVFEKGSDIEAHITKGAHFVLIGGEAFPHPKFIWWNFVSSSKEKLKEARHNWNTGNFPQVPGDSHIIPAPEGII